MARVYATGTEYADWLGVASPPAGADRALRAASEIVEEMLRTAIYVTDSITGLPTDAAVITALMEATCAQAEYLARTDPGAIGTSAAGGITKFSLGGLSVDRSSGSSTSAADPRLPARWSPRAYRILTQAMLTGTSPWTT